MTKKILIIEDNAMTSELLALTLQCFDCRILIAGDGLSGLAIARAELPALVFLDITLPDLVGLEVCRRLKADPTTANIKVVMISGLCQAEDIKAGLDTGALDYLTKPFSPLALLDKVSAWLGLDEFGRVVVGDHRVLNTTKGTQLEQD